MKSRLLAACLTLAPTLLLAQPPRVYTPDTPPRTGEMTLLNTTVTAIDRAGATITVRVDKRQDGVVDRARTETFPLDPAVVKSSSDIKVGSSVLITLSGRTVVGLKLSIPAGAATPGRTPAPLPGGVTPTAPVGVPAAPPPGATVAPPAPGVVVVPPAAGEIITPMPPVPAIPSPSPVGTPFPTPRPVPTPQPVGTPRPVGTPKPVGTPPVVGTPRPVLVPTEPPPTTLPSPSPLPTPPPRP